MTKIARSHLTAGDGALHWSAHGRSDPDHWALTCCAHLAGANGEEETIPGIQGKFLIEIGPWGWGIDGDTVATRDDTEGNIFL